MKFDFDFDLDEIVLDLLPEKWTVWNWSFPRYFPLAGRSGRR
jgi:hypothetical protein